MGDTPKWSMVTVTYNSGQALTEHWSGFEPDQTFEWIVVDNASTDGSAAIAERLGAKVLRLGANRGFSAANNLGASRASGEFLLFVNPDVVVDTSTLKALETCLRNGGGIVAPQLTDNRGEMQPNGRGFPYLSWKVRHRLPFRWVGIEKYRKYADAGVILDVPWVTGAVVAVSREDFSLLGGWDESFFLYYEDTDLSLRAHKQGMTVRVVGDVRWLHSWARDTARFSIKPWLREISSAITFYRRYPEFLRIRF